MAGYSDKPLLKKLGYQAGESVFLVTTSPPDFRQQLRAAGVVPSVVLPAHWAHGFFKSQSELWKFLDTINLDQVEKALWVSWPKKSSGVDTDLTEQSFWDMILPLGWVDIKVAAIDETWSGLKFTRRKA